MSCKSEGNVRSGDMAGRSAGGRYIRRSTGAVNAIRRGGEVIGLRSSRSGFTVGLRAILKGSALFRA